MSRVRDKGVRSRVGLSAAWLLWWCVCLTQLGCGAAMHGVVHTAIHGTLNTQFRSAGIAHPEPLSEALEYFCLDDMDHARSFIRDAYRNNAPEQLMAVARVLREITPLLGSYGEKVAPFLDFLSGAQDATATPPEGSGAPARVEAIAAPATPAMEVTSGGRCASNLGHVGESCTSSPECLTDLGCIDHQCRVRRLPVASEATTIVAQAPTEVAPPPEPTSLTPLQVRAVLVPLAERVRSCVTGLRGSAPLALVVVADGTVAEAHVGGPLENTRAAACIQNLVMSLRFPRFTQERLTVNWPVPLRADGPSDDERALATADAPVAPEPGDFHPAAADLTARRRRPRHGHARARIGN